MRTRPPRAASFEDEVEARASECGRPTRVSNKLWRIRPRSNPIVRGADVSRDALWNCFDRERAHGEVAVSTTQAFKGRAQRFRNIFVDEFGSTILNTSGGTVFRQI